MLASILIIAFSLVLFVYWFRYSCLLLLRNGVEHAEAESGRFNYAYVRQGLKSGMALDPLHASLQRDYQVLTFLLQHATSLELEQLECKLLVLDYKLMRGWYRLTKSAAPEQARRALAEMADILSVLVSHITSDRALLNSAR
jgi:hypothetical protein